MKKIVAVSYEGRSKNAVAVILGLQSAPLYISFSVSKAKKYKVSKCKMRSYNMVVCWIVSAH